MKTTTTTTTTSETVIFLNCEEEHVVEKALSELLGIINNSKGKISISNTTLIISGSTIKVIDHNEKTYTSDIDTAKLF